jgi:heme/copper-type cytochrome/quinol oxidase subunit 3
MALFFTLLQVMEYFGVSYTITDSVYGSTFYMGTGLILGHVLLIINKYNFLKVTSSKLTFKNIINNSFIMNESAISRSISPY